MRRTAFCICAKTRALINLETSLDFDYSNMYKECKHVQLSKV